MTRRRPVWFRDGVVRRNDAGPVTGRGYAIAMAAHPLAGSLVLFGGIGSSLIASIVALSPYGEP